MPDELAPHPESSVPFSPEIQKIKDNLVKVYVAIGKDKSKAIEINRELVARQRYLKKEYPDFDQYQALYVLFTAGLPPNNKGADFYTKLDFPGQDSVKLFVEELLKKYQVDNVFKSDNI